MTYGAKSSPIGWVGVVNQSPLRRNVLGLAVAGTFFFFLCSFSPGSNFAGFKLEVAAEKPWRNKNWGRWGAGQERACIDGAKPCLCPWLQRRPSGPARKPLVTSILESHGNPEPRGGGGAGADR